MDVFDESGTVVAQHPIQEAQYEPKPSDNMEAILQDALRKEAAGHRHTIVTINSSGGPNPIKLFGKVELLSVNLEGGRNYRVSIAAVKRVAEQYRKWQSATPEEREKM